MRPSRRPSCLRYTQGDLQLRNNLHEPFSTNSFHRTEFQKNGNRRKWVNSFSKTECLT